MKSAIRRTKSLKPVVQLERTGCGIASVAVLAGVSYKAAQRAARHLGIMAADDRLWSHTSHVRCLLKRYGLRAHRAETPFSCWSALPARALLAVKWHCKRGKPFWHWVVFARDQGSGYVLDSAAVLKRHVRTDFGRIKPRWFIGIVGTRRSTSRRHARTRRH